MSRSSRKKAISQCVWKYAGIFQRCLLYKFDMRKRRRPSACVAPFCLSDAPHFIAGRRKISNLSSFWMMKLSGEDWTYKFSKMLLHNSSFTLLCAWYFNHLLALINQQSTLDVLKSRVLVELAKCVHGQWRKIEWTGGAKIEFTKEINEFPVDKGRAKN